LTLIASISSGGADRARPCQSTSYRVCEEVAPTVVTLRCEGLALRPISADGNRGDSQSAPKVKGTKQLTSIGARQGIVPVASRRRRWATITRFLVNDAIYRKSCFPLVVDTVGDDRRRPKRMGEQPPRRHKKSSLPYVWIISLFCGSGQVRERGDTVVHQLQLDQSVIILNDFVSE
jgi:hypothetical protein